MNTRQDSLTSVTERAFLMANGFLAVSLAILRGSAAIPSQDPLPRPGDVRPKAPLSADRSKWVTRCVVPVVKGFLAVSLTILRGSVAVFSQDRPPAPGNGQYREPLLSADELVIPSRLSSESMNPIFRQPVTV